MEFAAARWRIRVYNRNDDAGGIPTGSPVYESRCFPQFHQGGAVSRPTGRREEQMTLVTCILSDTVKGGLAARLTNLLGSSEDTWWAVDTIVRHPENRTMVVGLESQAWVLTEIMGG